MFNRFRSAFFAGSLVILATLTGYGQQVHRAPFDVTNYVMDVQLTPNDRKLSATVDVTFLPQEDTRTVAFEMNGSLKIESIARAGGGTSVPPVKPGVTKQAAKPAVISPGGTSVTFVQDQGGTSDLGP